MQFFRQLSQRYRFFWAISLVMALLCTQGLLLHVHSFSHTHQDKDSGALLGTEHAHVNFIHVAIDTSHGVFHDEVFAERDASPEGMLKILSNTLLVLAVFTLALILARPVRQTQRLRHQPVNDRLVPSPYQLSPPLRAPPHYS